MLDGRLCSAERPVYPNGLVHGPFFETSFPPAKKPHIVIRVPAPVPYPRSEKERLSGNPVAVARFRRRDDPADFLSVRRLDRLVRIQTQHPFSGSLVKSNILLFPIPQPLLVENLISIFPADVDGCVTASGIHDDNFIGPSNALKRAADVRLFVIRNEHD